MSHPPTTSRPGPSGADAAAGPLLADGSFFAGRYRIVRCIAVGGMGSVYEAIHLETERRRALKIMHAHLFHSDEMRERFKREARIAAQVESEHIVDVSDAGIDEATRMPFLVMELLQGEELGARLQRAGRLPPAEVMTYLHQIALALAKTHARSIVHRDLKPENVFVTAREDGAPRVKILDFGVAKLVAESTTAAGTTRSLGTPLYMAPEQFRVGPPLTPAADVHALGMMAFTLLVGEPYWSPEAKAAGDVIAFAMIASGGPREPASARAAAHGVHLPPGFDAWFARVTAQRPADRFPSALAAVRALGEVLGAAPGAGTVVLPAVPGAATTAMAKTLVAATPVATAAVGTASTAPVATTAPGAERERAGAARPRRGPLLVAAAVLGVGLVSVSGWLAVRAMRGPDAPVSPAAPAALVPVSGDGGAHADPASNTISILREGGAGADDAPEVTTGAAPDAGAEPDAGPAPSFTKTGAPSGKKPPTPHRPDVLRPAAKPKAGPPPAAAATTAVTSTAPPPTAPLFGRD